MIPALLAVPTLAGLLAFLLRSDTLRRLLLVVAATAHLALTAGALWTRPPAMSQGWLELDPLGALFLGSESVLFFAVALYAVGFFRRTEAVVRSAPTNEPGTGLTEMLPRPHDTAVTPISSRRFLVRIHSSESIFTGCLLLLLGAITLAMLSQHVALFWVGMESATLATAPLLYFHRTSRSLEATWKYLLIGSVGIALALLGVFFLQTAAFAPGGQGLPLVMQELTQQASKLNPIWLKAATIFLLVGWGTKMGLAPLHTWKPDAYSESPAVVAALLSGGLTNCAFLGVLRVQQVCAAAGMADFSQEILLVFGLVSMAVAAVFIVGQSDYKRLLAYSSVEHMGVLVLGVGLGGLGAFAALWHALNNALIKPALFFVAGNILAVYKTRSTAGVTGVMRVAPLSGVLWLGGFLAAAGFPPFGTFLSELGILRAGLMQGQGAIAGLYLFLLLVAFVGSASIFVRMTFGAAPASHADSERSEALLTVVPPLVLGLLAIIMGLCLPAPLRELLHAAARSVGGY